jgi:lipopolysaccharide biosynthesis glycosyltransferase
MWTIRSVDYINEASPWFYWNYHTSRFKQVFTKLRVINDFSGEYKKVILLDLDLLVRGEVDSLFELNAPAAMVRGHAKHYGHGNPVPIDGMYTSHRQTVGINCGVMLIEPSASVFSQMWKEVTEHYRHPEHWPSHGPEQDYLSRFYNAYGTWTNISCRYNYQIHLTKFGSLEWHHYNRKGFKKVSVFHFSGRLVKPWEILLDLLIAHAQSYDEIIEFVHNIPEKGLSESTPILSDESSDIEYDLVIDTTNFCFGTGALQRGCKRCYLDRKIHPSWVQGDSDAVIEWIHAFKEADEFTNGQTVELLKQLWAKEKKSRPI